MNIKNNNNRFNFRVQFLIVFLCYFYSYAQDIESSSKDFDKIKRKALLKNYLASDEYYVFKDTVYTYSNVIKLIAAIQRQNRAKEDIRLAGIYIQQKWISNDSIFNRLSMYNFISSKHISQQRLNDIVDHHLLDQSKEIINTRFDPESIDLPLLASNEHNSLSVNKDFPTLLIVESEIRENYEKDYDFLYEGLKNIQRTMGHQLNCVHLMPFSKKVTKKIVNEYELKGNIFYKAYNFIDNAIKSNGRFKIILLDKDQKVVFITELIKYKDFFRTIEKHINSLLQT